MVRLCSLADEIARSRGLGSAESQFFSLVLGVVNRRSPGIPYGGRGLIFLSGPTPVSGCEL